MAFTNTGADRFLNAVIGQVVSAASANTVKGRLHTAALPTTGNELSGGGYKEAALTPSAFTRSTSGNYRRLNFPAMEWFANASTSAQTAESIGLWYGSTLVWYGVEQITPQNARVAAVAGSVILGIEISDASLILTTSAIDRGLRAIAGEAVAAADMYWELHGGAGIPTSSNRLTGGGIDGVPDAAWSFSTVSEWRRATQGLITFTTGLTADTNVEPTKIALWRGRPEQSGVLHAYRDLSPNAETAEDAAITVPADSLYIELMLIGVVQ